MNKLPQTSTQFRFEILLQLAHNFVNLNIGQGFCVVLNGKTHRIRFLAFRKIFALVNIKQIHIFLPFDDANNDGYIAFKIKTLPTLVVNDTFTNDASIYFDYNFPVVTKLASSTFKTLGTQDFEFANYFTLYPNPAKSFLNISSKENIEVQSISIYNTLGQLVMVVPSAEKVSKIDVSSLTAGNYFIKINSDKGSSNTRLVKE